MNTICAFRHKKRVMTHTDKQTAFHQAEIKTFGCCAVKNNIVVLQDGKLTFEAVQPIVLTFEVNLNCNVIRNMTFNCTNIIYAC